MEASAPIDNWNASSIQNISTLSSSSLQKLTSSGGHLVRHVVDKDGWSTLRWVFSPEVGQGGAFLIILIDFVVVYQTRRAEEEIALPPIPISCPSAVPVSGNASTGMKWGRNPTRRWTCGAQREEVLPRDTDRNLVLFVAPAVPAEGAAINVIRMPCPLAYG
jgi:hypothetical protein